MNTFTSTDPSSQRNSPQPDNRSTASGVHRGIWIGGGLMALTIIALATTLVVKNTDTDSSAGATAQIVSPTTTASTAAAGPASPTVAQGSETPAPVVAAQQQPDAARVAPVVRHPQQRPYPYGSGGYVADSSTAGGGPSVAYSPPPQRVAEAKVCTTCGVIDSYSAVQVQGQANGVGAVAGGLGGALVGSQIAGRNNHTLGGVIGAIGGGLLGNTIEKHERTVTEYDVRVRMNDGSYRTFRENNVPTVGSRVYVEGHTLHTASQQG